MPTLPLPAKHRQQPRMHARPAVRQCHLLALADRGSLVRCEQAVWGVHIPLRLGQVLYLHHHHHYPRMRLLLRVWAQLDVSRCSRSHNSRQPVPRHLLLQAASISHQVEPPLQHLPAALARQSVAPMLLPPQLHATMQLQLHRLLHQLHAQAAIPTPRTPLHASVVQALPV